MGMDNEIKHMKTFIPGSHYFSFFALSKLLTQPCLHFLHDRTALLLNMQHVHSLYYLISLPRFAHILYFHAPNFLIKQISLIYFTVSVVKQWNK